jgi:hypothetical protein
VAELPADPVLGELEPLVGEWTVTVRGPDGQPWPGEGRATFRWHESGAHLVQQTVIDVPEAPDSTTIMGCDAAKGMFMQLYSDERGVSRIYEMTLDNRKWTLMRDGEPFPQRFLATLSDDGQRIDGVWEKAENGIDFSVDFYLTYRKIEPG